MCACFCRSSLFFHSMLQLGACPETILLVWVQNFDTQYEFAIQTLSTVILTTFQLRCQAAGNSAATCAYTLPNFS